MKRKDNNEASKSFIDRLNKKNGSLKNEREQGGEVEDSFMDERERNENEGRVSPRTGETTAKPWGTVAGGGAATAVNGMGLDEDALALAMKMMKKKSRVYQRSIKLDEKINRWLDNVKRYQKEDLGIARPCLDDLMYEAIVEFLKRHYEELEP